MAEYIERGELLRHIEANINLAKGKQEGKYGSEFWEGYVKGEEQAFKVLHESVSIKPAADVAPVVRCKDCVHYKGLLSGIENLMMCACDTQFRSPFDFCSYGQKKEDET